MPFRAFADSLRHSGIQVILSTPEQDLKTVAETTLTIPTGCKFWIDEVGIICTSLAALTTQPTFRAGISGNPAKQSAATTTTTLTAAGKRERRTPIAPEDGETTLTAGITVAAVATTMRGRFYWRGILLEDQ